MKEIIAAVALLVGLWQGTTRLKELHDFVRIAALEKAAQGLPSLTGINHKLTRSK